MFPTRIRSSSKERFPPLYSPPPAVITEPIHPPDILKPPIVPELAFIIPLKVPESAENENERNQVAWLEERIAQRDAKIDAIYVELREEQSAHLEDIHKRYVAELQLKEAELSRCDLWECLKRIPPKFKNKIKEEQL